MILETAFISITPGREEEFIAAVTKFGMPILQQATGFESVRIQRGIERNSTILLILKWQTLEDHTVGFRQGPLFAQWREVISPFFAQAPEVEHWHLSSPTN